MTQILLDRLQQIHKTAHGLIAVLNEQEARRQYDSNLSPAGWHIGHMAVMETYWLREVMLEKNIASAWKEFYFPEFNAKHLRSEKLPAKEELMAFAADLHRTNIELLSNLIAREYNHALLKEHYLPLFFIQHHSQHLETLEQISQLRALAESPGYSVKNSCPARAPVPPAVKFSAQTVSLGHAGGPEAYDNELPRHSVDLAGFAIGAAAVSNAEYLGFMQAQGYTTARYWSEPGRHWLQAADVRAPHHWRRDRAGHWYAVAAAGAEDLIPQAAVYGINYYEAEAFARYAGCRLPSEQEWECAAACGALDDAGIHVWEWCANTFYPYPGFTSFPYSGYSTPWFGTHYTLRGGSRHTAAWVKRPTFRNFYTADKRHIFAGLRLTKTL